MSASGAAKRRLVRRAQPWHQHHTPAWSGTRVVYASNRVSDFNTELFAVPARRLTFTTGSAAVLGDDSMPDFMPDGRRIVFTSNRDQQGEIYVMNANGSGQKRLTRRAGDDWAPDVSPDGARIAFTQLPGTIWTMNADGTGLRRLAAGTDADWRPSPSLEGREHRSRPRNAASSGRTPCLPEAPSRVVVAAVALGDGDGLHDLAVHVDVLLLRVQPDGVVPRAAVDLVDLAVARERVEDVVAVAAGLAVGAPARPHAVVAGAAVERVVARAAAEDVVSVSAGERVVVGAAQRRSFPSSPFRVSLPLIPWTRSLSAPALTVSLPACAQTRSLPEVPSASSLGVPLITVTACARAAPVTTSAASATTVPIEYLTFFIGKPPGSGEADAPILSARCQRPVRPT